MISSFIYINVMHYKCYEINKYVTKNHMISKNIDYQYKSLIILVLENGHIFMIELEKKFLILFQIYFKSKQF